MSSPQIQPHLSRQDDKVHLSYELQHRVHTAKVYPIKAPNGSSLIVYGHDDGITVLWRGGKRFKPSSCQPEAETSQSEVNQAGSSDAVVITDSDKEEDSLPSQPQDIPKAVDFESEEEEFDESRPFESIIHQHTVSLKTGALHIAVAPLPSTTTSLSGSSVPSLFKNKAVVAVACADCTVRLVTTPLIPLQQGHADEITIFESFPKQSGAARGVALTWCLSRVLAPGVDVDEVDEDPKIPVRGARRRSSLSRKRSRNRKGSSTWEVVLASHSASASGLLSVSHFPLMSQTKLPKMALATTQNLYLSSPAISVSFNTWSDSRPYHAQLLIVESKGAIRIFNPYLSKEHNILQSDEVGLDPSAAVSKHPGSWLASFYPPFEDAASSTTIPQRKRIIDAQWACGGNCIAVLLNGGVWGLWDLENASLGRKAELHKGISDGALIGSAITPFTLRGYVNEAPAPAKVNFQPSDSSTTRGMKKLTPMTPNTRKSKQSSLFGGSGEKQPRLTLFRGGISVQPSAEPENAKLADESLLIWYADQILAINSLKKHWQRAAENIADGGSSSIFNIPATFKITPRTGGESITGIAQFPFKPIRAGASSSSSMGSLQSDILVPAEHRLLIISPDKCHREEQGYDDPLQPTTRTTSYSIMPSTTEKELLSRGELDISGMDRLLNGFRGGGTVGFAPMS